MVFQPITVEQAPPAPLTKAAVGLDKVDNTTDAQKPVSTAQAQALAEVDEVADSALATAQAATAQAEQALEQAQQPFSLLVGSYLTGDGLTNESPLNANELMLTTLIKKHTIASTSWDGTTLTLTMGDGSTKTQNLTIAGGGGGADGGASPTPPVGTPTQDAMRMAGVSVVSNGNPSPAPEGIASAYDNDGTTKMFLSTADGQPVSASNPLFLQLDAGAGKSHNIKQLQLRCVGSTDGDFGPRIYDFELLGSNDPNFPAASSYSLLTVVNNQMGYNTLTAFDPTAFGSFRYHRFNATKTAGNLLVIADLQLLQVPA